MKLLHFFKGLSWLIILNLLVKPVWIFFIDRQVQNIVGFEEYGEYFAVLNLSYVLFFLADAGLSNMMNQRMSGNLWVNVGQLLQLKFFLLLVYTGICFFAAWVSGIDQWEILLYVVIAQALASLFLFLRSIITAAQFFIADAWLSIIDKLLMVILCGALIYTSLFGSLSLLLFLQIQTACTAIAIIISFLFILSKKLIVAEKKEEIKKVFEQTFPFAIIILLMSLHYRLDGFLLERMNPNGAMEAGIYASAYRLLDAGNMIGYLSGSFLVPFIAKNQNEKKLVGQAVLFTGQGLLFLSMMAITFTMVFAGWMQQLLYHTSNDYNTLIIQLCMAALPGYYLVHVCGSVLTATSKFKLFTRVLFLSVAINAILNFILIPSYGALGSSIAALVSQYTCGVALFFAASKELELSLGYRSGLFYLLTALLLFFLFLIAKSAMMNVWIILILAICIILFFLIRQLRFFKKYFVSLH